MGYLFPSKPFGYETDLWLPGIIGALVGYAAGHCAGKRRWSITGRWALVAALAVLTLIFNILYLEMVRIGGYPWWYAWVLFPLFTVQVACAFALFGFLQLRLGAVDKGSEHRPE
ncbi:MAG: hypothetical protein IVW54_18475 [Candidatus Binataceae bacterium]|nr:hypothetical protein [Candidatus Binataceae bacterium]